MAIQKEEAIKLLNRYMDGATTLEEERLIAEFLLSPDAGEEFDDYKVMFEAFSCGQPAFSKEELEAMANILPAQATRRRSLWFTAGKWMAAACLAVIAFVIGKQSNRQPVTQIQTEYITEVVEHTDTVMIEKPVIVTKYITKTEKQEDTPRSQPPVEMADATIEMRVNSLMEEFDFEQETENFNKDINNFTNMDFSI